MLNFGNVDRCELESSSLIMSSACAFSVLTLFRASCAWMLTDGRGLASVASRHARSRIVSVLDGCSLRVTLSVGRESGTWMDKDWGASGARLSLPLTVDFTSEPAEVGFFRDSMLDSYDTVKELTCTGGTFVGSQGEVSVRADGGAWTVSAPGRCGQRFINFYIDFPESATRNDVTLPAGRVFFRTGCWDGDALAACETESVEMQEEMNSLAAAANYSWIPSAGEGNLIERAANLQKSVRRNERGAFLVEEYRILRRALPDSEGCFQGPGDLQLAQGGGLSIKRNDARNLWGFAGDVYLILGKFTVAPCVAPDPESQTATRRA